MVREKKKLTRDQLRSGLLGNNIKAKSKVITVFGFEMELKQPTFGDIMDARQIEDTKVQAAHLIINYAYIPGTNERIFEEGDMDAILGWPFSADLMLLQQTIGDLSSLNVEVAIEVMQDTPLSE